MILVHVEVARNISSAAEEIHKNYLRQKKYIKIALESLLSKGYFCMIAM